MIIWVDSTTGDELRSIVFDQQISAFAYCECDESVAVGFRNGDISINSLSVKCSFKEKSGTVRELCFIPDGSRIVSYGVTLRLWDVATGNLIWERAAFVCDLSCGVVDGTVTLAYYLLGKDVVELINCDTGEVKRTFKGYGVKFACPSNVILM